MKIKKIKIRGYSRRVYAFVFAGIFAITGVGYLLYSLAATGVVGLTGVVDTGAKMKANTSPSINGDVIAFNEGLSGRMQFRYYSASYPNIVVSPGNIVDGMLAGTSSSTSGNYIAYLSSKGVLQVYNWKTGQIVDTAQPVLANTSPSISGNIVSFQSSTSELNYFNISTNQAVNTHQLMAAATSPSISGNIIAFQSDAGYLKYFNLSTGLTTDTAQLMKEATSPSTSADKIAYQAQSTALSYFKIPSTAPNSLTWAANATAWQSIWYGPNTTLEVTNKSAEDTYYACFHYKVTANNTNLKLDVTANGRTSILGIKQLDAANIMPSYQSADTLGAPNCVSFKTTETQKSDIEFRVVLLGGPWNSVDVSYVTLNRHSGIGADQMNIAILGPTSPGIKHQSGTLLSDGTPSVVNTNQGMLSGTSPAIFGNIIAFQANVRTLYYWNIASGTSSNTNISMASGTSPSIFGNTIAFQNSNTNLFYYNLPNLPPPPSVTLTGPSAVNQGNGATLYYKTSNTNSCSMAGYTFDPTQSIDGAFYANSITAPTTYTITCTGTNGTKASASWTVSAVGPPSGTITGPASVVVGQSPALTISTANVANCKVNGVDVSPNGTYAAPEILDYTEYELKCGGADGTGTALIAKTGVSVVEIDYGEKGKAQNGEPSPSPTASTASNKAKYHYVQGQMDGNGFTGMSADIQTGKPRVTAEPGKGPHSLGQIGVSYWPYKAGEKKNGVEFGWIVGHTSSPGDTKPRIFVYNNIDDYGPYSCYNRACGAFRSTSSIKPGKALVEGSTHNYKISYSSKADRWYLFFDNQEIGYYDARIFATYSGSSFRSGNLASVWGEVAYYGKCIEMGNGLKGTSIGSTFASSTKVKFGESSWTSSNFNKVWADLPSNFNYGNATYNSFSFGGRGGEGC